MFSLAVTPARAVLDWPRIVLVRRMLGVSAALYALLHLVLYVADQKWNLVTVAWEIALRFYLTVGFVAVLGLAVLAWTSTDGWQKRLRHRWKALHRWAYALAGLALFHYALQAKINASDAVFWFGIFAWLMLWRALLGPGLWRLAALAPAAAGLPSPRAAVRCTPPPRSGPSPGAMTCVPRSRRANERSRSSPTATTRHVRRPRRTIPDTSTNDPRT